MSFCEPNLKFQLEKFEQLGLYFDYNLERLGLDDHDYPELVCQIATEWEKGWKFCDIQTKEAEMFHRIKPVEDEIGLIMRSNPEYKLGFVKSQWSDVSQSEREKRIAELREIMAKENEHMNDYIINAGELKCPYMKNHQELLRKMREK